MADPGGGSPEGGVRGAAVPGLGMGEVPGPGSQGQESGELGSRGMGGCRGRGSRGPRGLGTGPTCRRAREIQVRSSSPRRGPWFFRVVLTAMKTSSGRRRGAVAGRAGGARGPGPGAGARVGAGAGARGSGSGSSSSAARAAASARQARHSAPLAQLMRPRDPRARPGQARRGPFKSHPAHATTRKRRLRCPGSERRAAAGWAKMPLPVQVFNLQVTSRGRRPPRAPAAGPERGRPCAPPRAASSLRPGSGRSVPPVGPGSPAGPAR